MLVLLAAVAALRPDPNTVPRQVVVAARDLRPGITLTAEDVGLRPLPSATLPDGVPDMAEYQLGPAAAIAKPFARAQASASAFSRR